MAQKRLTLSQTDKKVAGVCGGLAEYFDMDATVVRIIFVVSVLVFGFGLLPYLILWLVLPSE
jgi:phage shock protein PspC (stress-responsive transcriptional regulator)